MKIKFCIFYFFLFNCILVFGQAPEIEWEKNFGGTNDDRAGSIIALADSGFLISGYSRSNDGDITLNHGGYDYWIIKLDSLGVKQWEKSFGGSETDYGGEIIELNDGYLITGLSSSTDGDVTENLGMGDGWIIKIDFSGVIQWEKSYGGTNSEGIHSIIKLTDGGFITAGYTYSTDGDCIGNHGDSDYWLMRIDADGNKIWSKCFGGSDYETALDLCQLSSGEIAICGVANSIDYDLTFKYGSDDFWILKIDIDGNLIWQKNYGGSNSDEAFGILENNSGKINCVGLTYSNDFNVSGLHGDLYSDYWIIEIDTSGLLVWQKCLGGSGSEQAYDILHGNNDELIITGVSSTSNNGDVTGHHGEMGYGDFWVVCIDTNKIIKWETSLGGTKSEFGYSIVNSIDTGLVIAGYSLSNDGDVGGHFGPLTYADYWVVKLNEPCESFIYYEDADGDMFGNSDVFIYSCFDTIGFVTNNTDCNDSDSTINPEEIDVCNGQDDNCNGLIDEDAMYLTWYLDNDLDGFGNVENDSVTCFELSGYSFDSTDCNDYDFSINPFAIEICNLIDDNCNELIDEGLTYLTYYVDADSDGYGNILVDSVDCSNPFGFVIDSTDCNDNDSTIYPEAPEFLNGIDDDCDQMIDEGLEINNALLSAIKIYPNPAIDQLFIETSLQENFEIEIFDATGRIVFNSAFNSNTNIFLINFSSGIYFMKIKSENRYAGIHFIKE